YDADEPADGDAALGEAGLPFFSVIPAKAGIPLVLFLLRVLRLSARIISFFARRDAGCAEKNGKRNKSGIPAFAGMTWRVVHSLQRRPRGPPRGATPAGSRTCTMPRRTRSAYVTPAQPRSFAIRFSAGRQSSPFPASHSSS